MSEVSRDTVQNVIHSMVCMSKVSKVSINICIYCFEGMMKQDNSTWQVLEAKTCTTTMGPSASWTKKGEEVVPKNSGTQGNTALPEDHKIVHTKPSLHLVKIHVFIIFLV